ncbi:helix-turn-helix transcriptional regulator [Streptomyces kunmingensis]|uniref:Helix-turn-helix transcriptional regulator n=1 Tax=Streptomyces kunmingensis TaxID=68225 RepID=A0ABU6CKL7_9ACTN|nr:helix-turn-helix transcriptional regulator [Streptomyces kunmingensis]MEB3965242.1 helix-turn-helix transcriptional regulator [Streptomyces kunmingensis]
MSTDSNAWRYCGSQIKLWRTGAGVAREALADEAGYGLEYVKSMENGRRKPTLRLLQVADQLCCAGGKIVAAQEFLKPDAHPERSQEFLALEKDAIAFSSYEPLLIPGLLQTREYAHALISDSCPPLDDETVEERVAGRIKRQTALTERKVVAFSFVLYEAVLRTVVGSRETMTEQFEQLLKWHELRNMTIQVLPYGRAYGVALNGAIALLETVDHERYAYVEGPETSVLYADGDKASSLATSHGMIRMHALSPEESAEFIRKVAEEL